MKELKATDLRIGNYVGIIETALLFDDINPSNNYFQISELGKCLTRFNGFSHGEYYKDIKPIELTPELFDKCGLKYLQNACWEFGSMRIYNLSDESKPRFRITLAGNELTVIKYVHELQNLYFALTGQELEVKF